MFEVILQALVSLGSLTVLLYGAAARNRLVRSRRRATELYAVVDAQLVRRHDEIPTLVEAARPWPADARVPLERLARLRAGLDRTSARAELVARVRLENELTVAFDQLFAILDKHEDHRRRQEIVASRARLARIEQRTADDRQVFNEAVIGFNEAAAGMAGGLAMRVCGFEQMLLLTAGTDAARTASLQWI